jgi:hypothetical protein
MNHELTKLESELLKLVPEDGSNIGNVSLIRTLGWPEEQYWDVRNQLLDKGILTTARGRGGSVQRLKQVGDQSKSLVEAVNLVEAKTSNSEYALYDPVAKVLSERWTKDYR